MRENALPRAAIMDATLDDFVVTPDGRVVLGPNVTTHISGEQWANAYNATAFANRLGLVLNVHVTILWDQVGLPHDGQVSAGLVRWTGELRKWCAARGYRCCYVYAHERSRRHGLHTHLLTSIPYRNRAQFMQWSVAYLARMSGLERLSKSAICVRHRREDDTERQWLWFNYIMKGGDYSIGVRDASDRRLIHALGDLTTCRHRPGGIVRCRRRVGVSRNLDIEARRSFGSDGFRSLFDEGVSDRGQLYTDLYLRASITEQELRRGDRLLAPLAF